MAIDFRSIWPSRRSSDSNDNVKGMNNYGLDPELDEYKEYGNNSTYTFFIMPYQRGYRWGRQDVKKLLLDLQRDSMMSDRQGCEKCARDSIDTIDNKFPFYCLQSLSVAKHDNSNNELEWELVDGQQRLTTILLIYDLLYLFTDELTKSPYTIKYDRGNDSIYDFSNDLLKLIKKYESITIDNENIKAVNICSGEYNNQKKKWFEELKNNLMSDDFFNNNQINSYEIDKKYCLDSICTILDCIVEGNWNRTNLSRLLNYIKYCTFFIWYEIPEKLDSKEVFSQLNSGKISLTNAEVIKSLILSQKANEESQININARRYENLEHKLNEIEFWAFLTGEDKASEVYETRIDFLLEICALKEKRITQDTDTKENSYWLFDLYSDWLESYEKECRSRDFSGAILNSLEDIYDRLFEWYNDVEVYHYVGLLTLLKKYGFSDDADKGVSQAKLILNLLIENTEEKCKVSKQETPNTKSLFINYLQQKIAKGIKKVVKIKEEEVIKVYEDYGNAVCEVIEYESYKNSVYAILWLLSVDEAMNSPENWIVEKDNTFSPKATVHNRFPFSQVSNKVWSIEHIFPQDPSDKSSYCASTNWNSGDETVNSIGNLALLQKRDNSALQNGNLDQKRNNLIKELIGNNSFVPSATINVFLLYYTYKWMDNNNPIQQDDLEYWTTTNKGYYEEAIRKLVNKYVGCLNNLVEYATEED